MNLLKRAEERIFAEETANLFFERSINEVTIKDIALHIGIGEATIYRHYTNKYNIVLLVAKYLQENVLAKYFNFSSNGDGYTKMDRFYRSFYDIFLSHPSYYRFINEFDAFIINNNPKDLAEYEEGIDAFKSTFNKIYEQGVNDGSIKPISNIESFYYGTTHALLALCKKLADKDVIAQDTRTDKAGEIEALIETILYRVSNK